MLHSLICRQQAFHFAALATSTASSRFSIMIAWWLDSNPNGSWHACGLVPATLACPGTGQHRCLCASLLGHGSCCQPHKALPTGSGEASHPAEKQYLRKKGKSLLASACMKAQASRCLNAYRANGQFHWTDGQPLGLMVSSLDSWPSVVTAVVLGAA